MFEDLGSFISKLESERELVRIDKLVDPNLEITEIATRSILENKPALFFENVKGSQKISRHYFLRTLKVPLIPF